MNKLSSDWLKEHENLAEEELLSSLHLSEYDDEHSVNQDLDIFNEYFDSSSSHDEEKEDVSSEEEKKQEIDSLSFRNDGLHLATEWHQPVKMVRIGMESLYLMFHHDNKTFLHVSSWLLLCLFVVMFALHLSEQFCIFLTCLICI